MRLLPADYAFRNLARRPVRNALTALALALAAAMTSAATAFVRGLSAGYENAATPDQAILLSAVAERDVLRSTVAAALPRLAEAELRGLRRLGGRPAVSGELHFGTYVRLGPASAGDGPRYAAFVRGVDGGAFLVHEVVTLVAGRAPRAGEAIVGRLAAAQAGGPAGAFDVGRVVRFEGGEFPIVGVFAAPGTTLESEIWAPVEELKGLTKRDDLSAVFLRGDGPDFLEELEVFAKRRLDLELVAIPAAEYYREAAEHLAPIGMLARLMTALIVLAALACGAGTISTAVFDRLRELAVLRAAGYGRLALAVSITLESLTLAAAGGLLGVALARFLLDGAVVDIAMGAFALAPDATSLAAGAGAALAAGLCGALPAAWRAARIPVAEALRAP
jgi:ABC-type antimicrobial peptide transport system permease subunit